MDETWYNGYKSIKEKFDYSYKGYNLKHLIPGYLSLDFSASPSTRDVFKAFYLSTKSIDLRKALDIQETTLITYLINRTDYRDLANATKSDYPQSVVVDLSSLPTVQFSPLSLSFIKHFWMALSIVFFRSIGKGIKFKLYYWGLTIKLLNQINLLEKAKSAKQINRYICFNSAYKDESVLTLYFKKRNIETISMQHGIFCDFKLFIPFDIINFDNCITDKVLCWGQSTVDYLKEHGFDQSQLILVGNPKYRNILIDQIDQSFDSCLVLLGREAYIDTNNKLLTVLKEYNKVNENKITFYIKKHPFLMDDTHKEHASITDKIIFIGKEHSAREVLTSNLANFSIAVNTTAYYESLALGKPSLRWTESENEVFHGMDDRFENRSELEHKISYFKEISQAKIKEDMAKVISYVFDPQTSTKNGL